MKFRTFDFLKPLKGALIIGLAGICVQIACLGVSTPAKASQTTVSSFTGKTYTHADAFDGLNIYNGIDVSKYQTTIDWSAVKNAGVDFAFIRLGYRSSSSGTLNSDAYYATNMTNAAAAGVKTGAYFFTQALTTTEAVQEANYAIERLSAYNVTMPVVIDFESVSSGTSKGRMYDANLTTAEYTAIVSAFCDIISSAGYTPAVYANKSCLSSTLDGAALAQRYKIWLANYTTQTTYANTYNYWQYSSTGSMAGISGNVDCDFYYAASLDSSNAEATSISSGTVSSIGTKTYTGSAIKPNVTVEVDDTTLKKGTDYTVSYSDNTVAGLATATITGIGNYKGTLTKTFKIKPRAISSIDTDTTSSKITLMWDNDTGASGFQVYKKTTYNGSYKLYKTVTVASGSEISIKNTGLKKSREYYFKIRGFATAGSSKVYSAYSKLDASALSTPKVAITSKKLTLNTKPSSSVNALVNVKTGFNLTYNGITYLKNGKKFIHVTYVTNSKSYSGYLPYKTSLKLYNGLYTSTTVNLRKSTSASSKLLSTIPSGTLLPELSDTDVDGTTWVKVNFTGKKKIITGYVSGDYLE